MGQGGSYFPSSQSNFALVLSGLTANTDYIFTFYSPPLEGGGTRKIVLDGADDGVGNDFTAQQGSGGSFQIVRYRYNSGASTTFTMNGVSGAGGIYAFTNELVVPEPGTVALLAAGAVPLLALRRRK
jgi:hypothetical protein